MINLNLNKDIFALSQRQHYLLLFTCFFLDKKNGISKSIIPDFKCFDIENFYVVGYGLDDNGKNRDLKAIYSKT